jgi:N-methylhydantoinase A
MVVDGAPSNDSFEIEWDLVVNSLSTEVSSVGAGGGSIIAVSPSGDITVGPASAGASPGPACYGRGGTLPTVTDACLLMGILDPFAASGRAGAGCLRAAPSPRSRRRCRSSSASPRLTASRSTTSPGSRQHHDPPAPIRVTSASSPGAAGMLLPAALEQLAQRVIVPPHLGCSRRSAC